LAKKIAVQDVLERMDKAVGRKAGRVHPVTVPVFAVKDSTDEEVMVALVSDIQLGHMTPTTNSRVIKKRMERMTEGVVRIAQLHRQMYPIRKLVIWLGGDYVQNLPPWFASFDELDATLFKQVYEHAVPAMTKMLLTWCANFEEVEVHALHGNHGKVLQKGMDETFNVDTIIHMTLEERLRDQPNIKFTYDPQRFWIKFDVCGWTFLGFHGDQIKATFSGIPWYGVVTRVMRLQGSLPGKKADYVCLGHWHVASDFDWGDTTIFMNGCFITDDQYVLRSMGLASQAKQWVMGVTRKRGVTWTYKIDLDR